MKVQSRRLVNRLAVVGMIILGLIVIGWAITGCSTIGPGPAIQPQAAVHTMHMHRYRAEGDSALRLLNESRGTQSRDHGARVREAARKGEIPQAKGCIPHRVEIRGYKSQGPLAVLVNNRDAHRIAPQSGIIAFPFEICDGEGTIALDPMQVEPEMTLFVFGPPGIYPRGGLLRTCTREEILSKRTACGPLKGDPDVRWGELYFLTRSYLRSHYHMVE